MARCSSSMNFFFFSLRRNETTQIKHTHTHKTINNQQSSPTIDNRHIREQGDEFGARATFVLVDVARRRLQRELHLCASLACNAD